MSEPKGSRCAMSHRYSTKISSLEATARRICESRGGKWSGTKGMACCPAHDDRTPSLGVSLGRGAILLHCFAGCDQETVLAALAREGVPASALFSGGAIEPTMDTGPAAKPSAAALRIWRDAEPLRASPAKAYLESRGILAASSALRFHPRTPLGPKGRTRFLPAMIAAVSLDEGPIAIHRTFLFEQCQGRFRQSRSARLARSVKLLSACSLRPPASSALPRVSRARCRPMLSPAFPSGRPWAMSASVSSSVPESVTELHLFVDHDAGGELAASRGLAAYAREGRTIQVRKPSSRDTDWNDELTAWLRRKAAR